MSEVNFLLTIDGEQTLATLSGYLIYLRALMFDGPVKAEVDHNGLLMVSYHKAGVRHLHIIDADHWVIEDIVDRIYRVKGWV